MTQHLPIHGSEPRSNAAGPLGIYGTDAFKIEKLIDASPELGEPLHPAFPINGAQVIWAARNEMARTVDDVLARRTRALFLNAQAALEMAPAVARLMAAELGQTAAWQEKQTREFSEVAHCFMVTQPSDP